MAGKYVNLNHPAKKLGVVGVLIRIIAAMLCIAATLEMVTGLALTSGTASRSVGGTVSDVQILDKYDSFMNNEISDALQGMVEIERHYWLSDSDLVAPEPNAENYGHVATKDEAMEVVERARKLLKGQETLFERTPAENIWDLEGVHYYLDETIMVITWKQIINKSVFTISEVKVADPSQFRRALAGGEFGHDKQYTATEIASGVNAVVASSGDFYKYRKEGIVVYQGKLQRATDAHVDTCYIDDKGDLLFTYRNQLQTEENALKFVEENNVRFSLAFGPVLVDNGVACAPDSYSLGEVKEKFSRAAVCQMDELHYLLVSLGGDPPKGYIRRQTIKDFAKALENMGVQKAYALDGGQTTVIAMDNEVINYPDYGTQRTMSDIIYFATALPDGG